MTQIEAARGGQVTPQIAAVAAKERRDAEFIRKLVAEGTAVIPANRNHTSLEPIGIARVLSTKINANIGNSELSSCAGTEIRKMRAALKYGADTVMDLSTGGDIEIIRRSILAACPAPLGTVPVYEAVARYGGKNIGGDNIMNVIRDQAEQGVDYMTIHAGLLRNHVPLALRRKLGIVSRGGALLAAWMTENRRSGYPACSQGRTRHGGKSRCYPPCTGNRHPVPGPCPRHSGVI